MSYMEEQRLEQLEEDYKELKRTNIALLEQMKVLVEGMTAQNTAANQRDEMLKQIMETINENTADLQEIGENTAESLGIGTGTVKLVKAVGKLLETQEEKREKEFKKLGGHLKNIDSIQR